MEGSDQAVERTVAYSHRQTVAPQKSGPSFIPERLPHGPPQSKKLISVVSGEHSLAY